ncbi:MAG TPA: hypothetical protein PLP28_14855, partial [Flavobacteriales bacterium]|nr:hypothetical protein [Flavobacteriales bacterium]
MANGSHQSGGCRSSFHAGLSTVLSGTAFGLARARSVTSTSFIRPTNMKNACLCLFMLFAGSLPAQEHRPQ